ncbi:enoyl-CoA hydratase/isomerase family protein [Phenylobacterium sp.]|uniref:enoyl-CoA hydratase/isomerase family protein n=1 Tax=Phenylobacterium sp. TaxID=1871053 RepID=UPI0027344DD8|nr:enoyl-CoA hydratase-related protein [Phenylobacterium sp.]MDP3658631.1 enoyl-CoA hydratase-related protein [Phenylobacterium sp.]
MDYRIDELADGAVFTLTRPQKLNAGTLEIWNGLEACMNALEARGARLLILTGEGDKAFCAGTDLAESAAMTRDASFAKGDRVRALLVRLSRSKLISVAAINGLAYGGGLEIAMACTFRIAAPHVRLSLPEVKLGVLPAYGGTQFLPALVGRARALDLMLSGRPIGAEEGLAWGLVNKIADAATPLVDQALDYARTITQFSPVAIDGIRHCVEASGSTVEEAGLKLESQEVRRVGVSDDAREGVAAFLEKRKAVFSGR